MKQDRVDVLKAAQKAAQRRGHRPNLSGWNLQGVDLSRVDFGQANLGHADLSNADLRGANLHRAFLGNADLRGANLAGASLSRAWLWETHLAPEQLLDVRDVNWALPGTHGLDWTMTEGGGLMEWYRHEPYASDPEHRRLAQHLLDGGWGGTLREAIETAGELAGR